MEVDKQTLRTALRKVRRLLTQAQVREFSAAICRQAQEMPQFKRAFSVGLYVSIDNEVDPSSLLLAAHLSEKAVFLPVVDQQRRAICFVQYRKNEPLVEGAFGIREPLLSPAEQRLQEADALPIPPLDILFLPLVAFDPSGCRLGYGGGYYDRLLAHQQQALGYKPLLIGLAYHCQQVPVLPRDPHDVPMDWVVTERECLTCSGAEA